MKEAKRENTTFVEAIKVLMGGGRIARRSWGGLKSLIAPKEDVEVSIGDFVYRQSNREVIVDFGDNLVGIGWSATSEDIFANDWMIVEAGPEGESQG